MHFHITWRHTLPVTTSVRKSVQGFNLPVLRLCSFSHKAQVQYTPCTADIGCIYFQRGSHKTRLKSTFSPLPWNHREYGTSNKQNQFPGPQTQLQTVSYPVALYPQFKEVSGSILSTIRNETVNTPQILLHIYLHSYFRPQCSKSVCGGNMIRNNYPACLKNKSQIDASY